MSYNEFKEMLIARIEEEVNGVDNVSIHPVQKTNGVKEGLAVMKKGSRIGYTVYPEDMYKAYQDGATFEGIFRDLKEKLEGPIDIQFSPEEEFLDYDRAKGRIMPRLISAGRNQDLLSEAPSVPFADLAVVFEYCFPAGENEEDHASILIKNEHAKIWGVTAEGLYETAYANIRDGRPPQIGTLGDVLSDLTGEPVETYTGPVPIHVLTCKGSWHGAAYMADMELLRKIAGSFGKDFIILPSSIHEVLLVPVNDEEAFSMEEFNSMVQGVNSEVVNDDEILSDHAYRYVYGENKIVY